MVALFEKFYLLIPNTFFKGLKIQNEFKNLKVGSQVKIILVKSLLYFKRSSAIYCWKKSNVSKNH